MMVNPEIVEIVWLDAQSSLSAMSIDKIDKSFKPVLTKSVGYLVKEHKEYIILAFMYFGSDVYKHWQLIPTGIIKSKRILKK